MRITTNIKNYLTLCLLLLAFSSNGQTIIGTGTLKITLNSDNGITVASIFDGNTEFLNLTDNELFSLDLRDLANNTTTTISSKTSWTTADIVLSNGDKDCTITFSNPNQANIPASLSVAVTIHTDGVQSQWDLSVSGVGNNHSLMEAIFPHISIEGDGGQFLTPAYSGQLTPNPENEGIDYEGLYPRGHSTNMQFMAYYKNNTGLYFGFHDPTASLKTFKAKSENAGVDVECTIPIPNKTLAGNDWDYAGHFELDVFNGDWFNAAMIYKTWASNHAEYWPTMTAERATRQAEIGKIGAWFYDFCYSGGAARSIASIQGSVQDCIDFIPNVPISTHLYSWHGKPFDDDYPEVFPAMAGLPEAITTLQDNGGEITLYFNGRMYDVELASFNGTGEPNATKKENGDYYTQQFYNSDGVLIDFAVMCPTTPTWQNILKDAGNNIANTIQAHGVYFDQVSGADPVQCMDPNHNHTLGGGNYWRSGYKTLINNTMSNPNVPDEEYITVEGGCDFLLDQVDGLLIEPWDKQNMVPAFPAVYGGKVQMIGTKNSTNTYGDDSFYAKLAQGFSFGIQPGRFTTWIAHDQNATAQAKPYVKQLATMRYKLRDFLAFGDMHYPPSVTPNNAIPNITSDWSQHNNNDPVRMVTISALQKSLWQNGNTIAFVFVNASRTENLDFDFNVIGAAYGLEGNLVIRAVTQDDDGINTTTTNNHTQNVTLAPMQIKAYIIKAANPLPVEMLSFTGYKRGASVALKWDTASEINFEGFKIMHSLDGDHWTTIGNIASKNNSLTQNNYQFLDRNPHQGLNYYRLKEIDLDGRYKYSNTISVQFTKREITISPNPTQGTIFINTQGQPLDKVLIYNQLGQAVYTSEHADPVLDISNLPKGLYTIMVQSKMELFNQLILLE